MKKIFTSIAVCLAATASMAQIGAVAPDFTVTDINGNSHNLYSYLNAGKVVVLDVSATWCGPCWQYHNGHYLEDLYAEFGPDGTDELVVLFYEGDATTNAQDLDGTDPSSQGDWITGANYPIINESPVQLNLSIYAPEGFPTINLISCADKKIKADFFYDQNQNTAIGLANMRAKVLEQIDACASVADVSENSILEATVAPNPATDMTSIRFSAESNQTATVQLYGVSGQLIHSTTHEIVSGDNDINVNLSALQAGTYFIKVITSASSSNMIPVVKK